MINKHIPNTFGQAFHLIFRSCIEPTKFKIKCKFCLDYHFRPEALSGWWLDVAQLARACHNLVNINGFSESLRDITHFLDFLYSIHKLNPNLLCLSEFECIVSEVFSHYSIRATDNEKRMCSVINSEIVELMTFPSTCRVNYFLYMYYCVHGYNSFKLPANELSCLCSYWQQLAVGLRYFFAHVINLIVFKLATADMVKVFLSLCTKCNEGIHSLRLLAYDIVSLFYPLSPVYDDCKFVATGVDVRGLDSVCISLLLRIITPKHVRYLNHCFIVDNGVPTGNVRAIPMIKEGGLTLAAQCIIDGTPLYNVTVSNSIQKNECKRLNRIYPPTSLLDRDHYVCLIGDILFHLVHGKWIGRSVTAGFLPSCSTDAVVGHCNKVLAMLTPFVPPQLVIGALIQSFQSQEVMYFYEMLQEGKNLWSYPRKDQYKVLKLHSSYIRKSAEHLNGRQISAAQCTKLPYHELFYGRSDQLSDIHKEYRNRCSRSYHFHTHIDGWDNTEWRQDPQGYTTAGSDFYNRLRTYATFYARQIMNNKPFTESYGDYILRRGEWMASGSVGGTLSSVTASSGQRVKLSKRGWSEQVPTESILAAMDVEPEERANAAEKLENGKPRLILAVEPFHYIISCYANHKFEERLNSIPGLEKGNIGLAAVRDIMVRVAISQNTSMHLSMLDYADFNIQHSPTAQSILFEKFAQEGRRIRCHPDWIRANEWLAKAKHNMTVNCPSGYKADFPAVWKIKQGMFSGTKGTDLINTLLNHAYFSIAHDLLAELTGLRLADLHHIHQGDDVWISSSSPHLSAALYSIINQMGGVMQEVKQMVGRQRGEYLRVLYSSGNATGYLSRATANMILKEIQSPIYQGHDRMASELFTSISAMVRRGLHPAMAQLLTDDLVPFWSSIRSSLGDKNPISLPEAVLYSPRSLGGLGGSYPGFLPTGINFHGIPQIPKVDVGISKDLLKKQLSYMTSDWIESVSTRLPPGFEEIDAEALRSMMLRTSYQPLEKAELGDLIARRQKRLVKSWRKKNSHVWTHIRMAPISNEVRSENIAGSLMSSTMVKSVMEGIPITIPVANQPWDFTIQHVFSRLHNVPESTIAFLSRSSLADRLTSLFRRTPFRSAEATRIALGGDEERLISFLLQLASSDSDIDLRAMTMLRDFAHRGQIAAIADVGSGGLELSNQLLLFLQPEIIQLLPAHLVNRVIIDLQFTTTDQHSKLIKICPGLWCASYISRMPRHPNFCSIFNVLY